MKFKVNGIAGESEGKEDGLPVVFIHAFPASRQMWRPQIEALKRDFRVISYDVRGFGESEAGDGQYMIEFYADDLFSVLDHLQLKQAVVCGLSMGGYIALRAAERSPERFSGLVLCDTKTEPDSSELKIKRAAGVQALKKFGVGPYAKKFVQSVLCANTKEKKPEVVKEVL